MIDRLFRFFKDESDKKEFRRVIVVSIQKTGTHLIEQALLELDFQVFHKGADCKIDDLDKLKKGQYVRTHFTPSDNLLMKFQENPQKYGIILNYRDPRDTIVSKMNWNKHDNSKVTHSMREYMKKVYSNFTEAELVERLIRSDKFRSNEYDILEQFKFSRALLFHPGVLKVKFEDLIGEKGGGNNEVQYETLKSITSYFGLEVDELKLKEIQNRVFNKDSLTFGKGKLRSFETTFSKRHHDLFETIHGQLLKDYGYN